MLQEAQGTLLRNLSAVLNSYTATKRLPLRCIMSMRFNPKALILTMTWLGSSMDGLGASPIDREEGFALFASSTMTARMFVPDMIDH